MLAGALEGQHWAGKARQQTEVSAGLRRSRDVLEIDNTAAVVLFAPPNEPASIKGGVDRRYGRDQVRSDRRSVGGPVEWLSREPGVCTHSV